MSPNDADGKANSSSRSSLIWVCTVCPGIFVQKLRIITVSFKDLLKISNQNFAAKSNNKMNLTELLGMHP